MALKRLLWWRHGGGLEICSTSPKSQKSAKIVKKIGIELIGYTFRLQNHGKIPRTFFGFLVAAATTDRVSFLKVISRVSVDRSTLNKSNEHRETSDSRP